MTSLFHDLLFHSADRFAERIALKARRSSITYRELAALSSRFADALVTLGLAKHDRVAVYLPKQLETVAAFFGTSLAGGVFVPVNPVLKSAQVQHILSDCNVRVLVTSKERFTSLTADLQSCKDLQHVVLVDTESPPSSTAFAIHSWSQLPPGNGVTRHRVIDVDMAAILYTSGSTGRPKGVVLSHRNLTTGAASVIEYLNIDGNDRLLAVLPLSFDYGLNQIITAIAVGAQATLLDHLFARDVIKTIVDDGITALAAVPPLWNQLAELPWPNEAKQSLRYITNSGGAMPQPTLQKLREQLPTTQVFLMYGLTEAFRSTYLPPTELDRRPGSMGKAIPNADVMVVRPDGTECNADEPGELVHRGSLVSMGYWNAPELTAARFKPAPRALAQLPFTEMAVWSGDTVKKDSEGYLYFIGRQDEMIKTSGYRVSPTEVEEALLSSLGVAEGVAFGVPHPKLGQAIVALVATRGASIKADNVLAHCRDRLPTFMVPLHIEVRSSLPRNANGKYDRKALALEFADKFAAS